ncbi:MAG TPA: trypsin-like serine protease, partial [Acidobacteriota bacterium]|nr:trypsin-like serine protease [Acidobacteriota bacterium]
MFFRFNLLLSLLVLISIPAFGQAKPDTISIASHNFKTGETSITAVSQTKKPSSGSSEIKLWGGSPSPQKGKFTPNDFTNHTWITNREALMTYPLSSVVKIWVTNSQGTAAGSGMLIGPRHVLTARHVIYNEDQGKWASSVKVAAGYGDPQDWSPFGESHGTQGMILVEPFPGTWSFDIGVIELDRPIGALAGSVGIAAQDDWGSLICLGNRFFEEGQFYFGGYPGQSFDGNSMRVWSGNFDYVSWHQLLFDNEAGPEPGDSGSCTFTFVENQPYIVAVHNGETPLISLCSLTITQASIQSRFDLFKLAHVAQFAEKSLTDASDLVPLDVRVGTGNNPKHQAPVLYPGEPIEGLNVKIHNYSATDWSGDLKYEVYLSTDAELDPTNDRLLGEGQDARSIPSLGTGVLTTSQHFLPI